MIKRFLLALFLTLAVFTAAFAQVSSGLPVPPYKGKLSSDPATCSIGSWYYSKVNSAFRYCSAVNTWSPWGGAGIGNTVTGATVGSVFYAGASGVLTQDNANFYRDATLFKVIQQETQTTGAFIFKFKGWNGASYTEGLRLESTDAAGYYPTFLVMKNGAYSTDAKFSTTTTNGVHISSNGNNVVHYLSSISYQIAKFSDNAANPAAQFIVNTNTQKGAVVKAAASQSADLFQVTDSSDNPLSGITGSGIVYQKGGAAVASAATITPTGNVFHVTGTTTITSVSGTGIPAGTCIHIIFDGALTFTDGSNLKLAGNFVTTADDTISLCYDGTNWYETARAVN